MIGRAGGVRVGVRLAAVNRSHREISSAFSLAAASYAFVTSSTTRNALSVRG